MIVKISRGAGIKGLVRYAFNGDKRTKSNKGAVIVGGTCSGLSQAQIMAELSMTRKLRPGIERPAWHCSLSLAPGEHLEDWQWHELTEEFMKRMGFSEFSLYSVIKHHDTEHEHVHIIASRIDLNGGVFHGKWEAKKALIAANDLAREYGLREVGKDAPRKSLKKGELEMGIRTGVKPPKLRLQNAIDSIIEPGMSAVEFAEKLTAAGITVRANIATTGTMSGFSFELDGIAFKGSSLGKAYTWAGLQKRGVDYEKERDSKKLARWGVVRADQNGNGVSEPGRAPGAGPGEPDGRDQRVDAGGAAGRQEHRGRGEIGPGSSPSVEVLDATPAAGDSSAGVAVGVGDDGGADGIDLGDLDISVNVVADLAAIGSDRGPHGGQRRDATAGNPPTLAPDHVAKIDAWRRQHAALGAPAYRLTLVPRLDADRSPINLGKSRIPGEPERFWTAEEVEAKIPELRRRNSMGWDIYITPIDPSHHYILVDDVKHEAYERLRGAGFVPALIQTSSPDNIQVILKAQKQADRRDEQSIANRIMSAINKDFGDPKISGVIHPFRMCGFMNAKPSKAEIKDGRRVRPIVRVLAATGAMCAKAEAALVAARAQADAMAAQKAEARQTAPQAQAAPFVQPEVGSGRSAIEAYRQEVSKVVGLAKKRGWVLDASKVDFDVAKRLLRAEFTENEVRGAMAVASPDISGRHKDVERYVRQTVEKAASALESQAKRSDQEEDGLKM
jgi:hypothetical protein